MRLLHWIPCTVVVTEFSGCSIRFAELVVRMEGRKPADIERISFTLIRFGADGRPDMDRYRLESGAALDQHLDFLGYAAPMENVIDMASTFQGMGCRWKPKPQEALAIEQAALGLSKVKWLTYSEETFAIEEDSRAKFPPCGQAPHLAVDPNNIPF